MLHRGLRIVQASTHTQITAGPQRQRMAQRETRRRATAARAMPPAMLVWRAHRHAAARALILVAK